MQLEANLSLDTQLYRSSSGSMAECRGSFDRDYSDLVMDSFILAKGSVSLGLAWQVYVHNQKYAVEIWIERC